MILFEFKIGSFRPVLGEFPPFKKLPNYRAGNLRSAVWSDKHCPSIPSRWLTHQLVNCKIKQHVQLFPFLFGTFSLQIRMSSPSNRLETKPKARFVSHPSKPTHPTNKEITKPDSSKTKHPVNVLIHTAACRSIKMAH